MRVHHIGYVVAECERFRANLPLQHVVKSVYDETQNARLELLDGGGVYVELIEPANEESFTWNFLQKKRGGYHHLCYEVAGEMEAMSILIEQRMVKVLGPLEAPLLDGWVLFARNRNREIVEFLWQK